MGLPPQLVDARGGQIFFRPGGDDGHLYLAAVGRGGGAGGEASSPFSGKIIRFDVDHIPGNEPQIFTSGLGD